MERYDEGSIAEQAGAGQPAPEQSPDAPEYTETSESAFVAETPSGGGGAGRATLVLAGLLAAGAAAVYFMHLKAAPKSATASTEATSASAAINQFLSEGDRNMKLMHDLLKNTEKIVQQFLNYPTLAQIRLEELKTNPFRFSSPKSASADDEDAARRQRELELAKKKEREAILQAVGRLKLQSVMHSGSLRTCIISGRAYTENQEVDGFTIERIQPHAVVLRRGGYRFELRMNNR